VSPDTGVTVEVEIAVNRAELAAVDVAGLVETAIETVAVSLAIPVPTPVMFNGTEIVEASPVTAGVADALPTVYVRVEAACAETAENPPRVSATAATAAMRLMLVFVDIIFLSEKVDLKNFFISAWPANTDS
jgi:hypothetical protein